MKPGLRIWVILILCLASVPTWAANASDADRLARIAEMYAEYRLDFPGIGEVTADTLAAWLVAENVILVDVRQEKERAVSVIPGAITDKELDTALANHPGYRIVVYCTIGYRSGKYTRALESKGLAAFNLVGGILGWVHEDGLVIHDGKDAYRVHVYGKKWSLLPAGYEAVW